MAGERTAVTWPPEGRLLLACVGARPAAEARQMAMEAVGAGLDWGLVLDLARRHGVIRLLWRFLSGPEPFPGPPPLLESLREESRRNALAALDRAGELVRIAEAASRRGIDFLSLKGPLLSVLAYGDPAMRPSNDLDFLIDPGSLRDFDGLLSGFGYRPDPPLDNLAGLGWGRGVSRYTNQVSYCRRDGRMVDVHLELQPGILPPLRGLRKPMERAVETSLGGVRVKTLDREALILYLCAHGAKHSWHRLLWLADLIRLASADPPPDRARLARLAGGNGRGLVRLGYLMCEITMGMARRLPDPAPAPVRDLATEMAGELFGPPLDTRCRRRILRLMPLWGWGPRARFLFELTTRPQISDLVSIPLPPRLAFLRRVARPVRLALVRLRRGARAR